MTTIPSSAADRAMQNVTCVVPTKDRPHFVDRLLYFLSAQRLTAPIIIADSSGDAERDKVVRIIQAYGLKNLKLISFEEDIAFYDKVSHSLDYVNTPYSYLCADDDFIFVSGVAACVDVLEADPSLCAAAGQLFVYNFDAAKNTSPFLPNALSIYPAKSEMASDIKLRLPLHLRNYNATFYSLYRTQSVQAAFKNAVRFSVNMRTAEILSSTMVLAEGARRVIDAPFGVRTSHNEALHRELSPLAVEMEKSMVREELQHAFHYLADRFSDSGVAREKMLLDFGENLAQFMRRARCPGSVCIEVKESIASSNDSADMRQRCANQGSFVEIVHSGPPFVAPKADRGELYLSIVLSEASPFGFKDGVMRTDIKRIAHKFSEVSVVERSVV
ncbi:MAG: TIGR00180 family glycosyltransferase [Alphaproteobacteria bacterium]|nr:TIGR00180 family glycosyltransferase [Alphaproteobacteria bacterium]